MTAEVKTLNRPVVASVRREVLKDDHCLHVTGSYLNYFCAPLQLPPSTLNIADNAERICSLYQCSVRCPWDSRPSCTFLPRISRPHRTLLRTIKINYNHNYVYKYRHIVHANDWDLYVLSHNVNNTGFIHMTRYYTYKIIYTWQTQFYSPGRSHTILSSSAFRRWV